MGKNAVFSLFTLALDSCGACVSMGRLKIERLVDQSLASPCFC